MSSNPTDPIEDEENLRADQKGMFRKREIFNRLIIKQITKGNIIQDFYAPRKDDDGSVEPILIGERYPGTKGAEAFLSKSEPKSEEISRVKKAINLVIMNLKRPLSLGFFYEDRWTEKGTPWNNKFEKMRHLPKRPKDFMGEADAIAGVLTRGPFSVYSEIDPKNGDVIHDLSALESLQPRKPFVNAGGFARVGKNAAGEFATKSITFQDKEYKPGSIGYPLAQKRFLVGLNSWSTFIDHLTYCHILGAQNNALATLKTLPSDHPLRIMIQPFITETTKVNNELIDGLIKYERSNVPSYTGYSLATLDKLMIDFVNNFDVRVLDPELRYTLRGVPLDDPKFPTVQSTVEIFKIYRSFSEAWCQEYMKNGVDDDTKAYVLALQEQTPNGIFPLVGIKSIDELTVWHVAHIAATLIFTGSVWHHNVNDLTGPYMFSFDVMPTAMDKNGFPTKGVVLEKRNSIVAASKYRYYVLPKEGQKTKSIKDILPEPSMKNIWTQFEDDLKKYKTRKDSKPSDIKDFCIDPFDITSSIHA